MAPAEIPPKKIHIRNKFGFKQSVLFIMFLFVSLANESYIISTKSSSSLWTEPAGLAFVNSVHWFTLNYPWKKHL